MIHRRLRQWVRIEVAVLVSNQESRQTLAATAWMQRFRALSIDWHGCLVFGFAFKSHTTRCQLRDGRQADPRSYLLRGMTLCRESGKGDSMRHRRRDGKLFSHPSTQEMAYETLPGCCTRPRLSWPSWYDEYMLRQHTKLWHLRTCMEKILAVSRRSRSY